MKRLIPVLATLALAAPAVPALAASRAGLVPDFNGDGYADLAIGLPYEDIGTVQNAGAVHVIYGSANGLTGANDQMWHEDVPGIAGTPETNDLFGSAVVAGDFNGDAYADLAIGVPGEGDNGLSDVGVVIVIYGSPSGLSTVIPSRVIEQQVNGYAGTLEAGDELGNALAAGDFNGDRYQDLAIGVWREDVGTIEDAGAVQIVYGSSAGLTAAGNQLWDQDSPNVNDGAAAGDRFGTALATGDFDCDGLFDLAIGVPYEDGSAVNAGGVNLLFGSSIGLTANNDLFFGFGQANAHYGAVLAGGDLVAGNCDDLAISAPDYDEQYTGGPFVQDSGYVQVRTGGSTNLSTVRSYTLNSLLHPDFDAVQPRFGAALAIGRFDDGGSTVARGIAIGASGDHNPSTSGGTISSVGSVYVGRRIDQPYNIYPFIQPGDQSWEVIYRTWMSSGGTVESGSRFGTALSAWDFGKSGGYTDLAIGVPREDLLLSGVTYDNAGIVQILYGGTYGFSSYPSYQAQTIRQAGSDGLGNLFDGTVETNDQFGGNL